MYDSVHYQNTSMQHAANFDGCKNDNFQLKCFDLFFILAQKHRLWPQSSHNLCFKAKIRKMYTPVNPNFTIYIKVECMGVYITRAC